MRENSAGSAPSDQPPRVPGLAPGPGDGPPVPPRRAGGRPRGGLGPTPGGRRYQRRRPRGERPPGSPPGPRHAGTPPPAPAPGADPPEPAPPPRAQPYRDLKSGDGRGAREGGFIAEGPDTLRLLLDSDVAVVSVLVKPATFEKLRGDLAAGAARRGAAPGGPWPFRVLVAHHRLIAGVVGMETSRGALAFGVPPARDAAQLGELAAGGAGCRLLAIDGSRDDANVGGMVRTASCLGCDAVLLSPDSAGAWTRRAIRTSMGHVFRVPVFRCDLPGTVRRLRADHGVESYAAGEAPRRAAPRPAG